MKQKYLVVRKDGSIPRWPAFVLAAADPAAVPAIRAYADAAEKLGMGSHYVKDVRGIADEFERYQKEHPDKLGAPDKPDDRGGCELVHILLNPSRWL